MALIRFLSHLVLAAAVFCAAGLGVLTAAEYERTGQWSVPKKERVVELIENFDGDLEPARLIYLNRRGIRIEGGPDISSKNMSSLVPEGKVASVPGFSGSKKNWRSIVKCVRSHLRHFEVEVTEERPSTDNFVLVHVGGRPQDIGLNDKRVGGLAPFNGDIIEHPVVFAFSKALKNRTRTTCETIVHELGHVYGLDHTMRCGDMMSYKSCGRKRLLNRSMPCGENGERECKNEQPQQNSFQHLLDTLGPKSRS
jgi:hypothetical protein